MSVQLAIYKYRHSLVTESPVHDALKMSLQLVDLTEDIHTKMKKVLAKNGVAPNQ